MPAELPAGETLPVETAPNPATATAATLSEVIARHEAPAATASAMHALPRVDEAAVEPAVDPVAERPAAVGAQRFDAADRGESIRVQPYRLPTDELRELASSAGLEWVLSTTTRSARCSRRWPPSRVSRASRVNRGDRCRSTTVRWCWSKPARTCRS